MEVGGFEVVELVRACSDEALDKDQDCSLEHKNRRKRNLLKEPQHANDTYHPDCPILHYPLIVPNESQIIEHVGDLPFPTETTEDQVEHRAKNIVVNT